MPVFLLLMILVSAQTRDTDFTMLTTFLVVLYLMYQAFND